MLYFTCTKFRYLLENKEVLHIIYTSLGVDGVSSEIPSLWEIVELHDIQLKCCRSFVVQEYLVGKIDHALSRGKRDVAIDLCEYTGVACRTWIDLVIQGQRSLYTVANSAVFIREMPMPYYFRVEVCGQKYHIDYKEAIFLLRYPNVVLQRPIEGMEQLITAILTIRDKIVIHKICNETGVIDIFKVAVSSYTNTINALEVLYIGEFNMVSIMCNFVGRYRWQDCILIATCYRYLHPQGDRIDCITEYVVEICSKILDKGTRDNDKLSTTIRGIISDMYRVISDKEELRQLLE